jgi:hypothetical protein
MGWLGKEGNSTQRRKDAEKEQKNILCALASLRLCVELEEVKEWKSFGF